MQVAPQRAESKAEILLVDDVQAQGEMVKDRIGQPAYYEIHSPESLEELRESIIFKIYEAALIDVVWQGENWNTPFVLGSNREIIRDGIDFAKFVFELTPRMAGAVALYSSIVNLGDPEVRNRIENLPYPPKEISKPLPVKDADIAAKFGPFIDEVNDVHRDNPLLKRPSFASEPLPARLRAFKAITSMYSKWMDFSFDSTRDYSWAVVSGLNVQKDFCGLPLNGGINRYGIVPLDRYPTEQTLKEIADRTGFFPFIFWNARRVDFLEPLFESAGVQLTNIPPTWRSFFGIAVSRQCANAYLAGREEQVLEWCGRLDDEVGKVEVAKRIYKTLRANSPNSLSRFAEDCKKRELPVIEDVLVGKVDRIDRDSGLAKLALRTLDDESFVETIPLIRLTKAGIEFEHTWFEYSVYQQPRGQVTSLIEPIDPEEDDA
jgi:hypothetical protein